MSENEVEEEPESGSEEEDLPLEQKLKICNFFVTSTCAGEQPQMIQNLQHFLKEYDDSAANQHLINRAEKCSQIVDGTIICEETKVENGYANSKTGKVISLTMKDRMLRAEEGEDFEVSDDVKALQNEVDDYVKTNYLAEASRAGAVMQTDDGFVVIISADKINLSNYWSGQMNSKYTIKDGKVNGTIEMKMHYFEGGNVMFDAKKEVEKEAGSSPKEIVEAIATLETDYQKAWSEYFAGADKQVLAVRRALTIQQTKFDWRISQADLTKSLGS